MVSVVECAVVHVCQQYGVCAAGTAEVQPLPSHVLQQEYELVKNAFYTEPHDQSSWLYLRWLIGNSLAGWEKCKGTEQQPSATQVTPCTIFSTCVASLVLHTT